MSIDNFPEGNFKIPFELTDEELAHKQAEFFANLKKINAANMALVVAKSAHKKATYPLKKENLLLEEVINSGVEEREIYAIEFVNESTATMDYLDPHNYGNVIYSRPLSPTERIQFKIPFRRIRATEEA